VQANPPLLTEARSEGCQNFYLDCRPELTSVICVLIVDHACDTAGNGSDGSAFRPSKKSSDGRACPSAACDDQGRFAGATLIVSAITAIVPVPIIALVAVVVPDLSRSVLLIVTLRPVVACALIPVTILLVIVIPLIEPLISS